MFGTCAVVCPTGFVWTKAVVVGRAHIIVQQQPAKTQTDSVEIELSIPRRGPEVVMMEYNKLIDEWPRFVRQLWF